MSPVPTLEGHGIRMEPIGPQHVDALLSTATEPTIWRYMPLILKTDADVRAWVDAGVALNEAGRHHVWITRLESGEVVGSSRYSDLDLQHRTTEIGFTWIVQKYRGGGVNPRMKLLQLAYGFEQLHLRRIALKTHHENLHSQNAMLKLGAQYEGTFRNHLIMPDGSTRHTRWYSIVAEEWPAVKARLLERIAAEPLQPYGSLQ